MLYLTIAPCFLQIRSGCGEESPNIALSEVARRSEGRQVAGNTRHGNAKRCEQRRVDWKRLADPSGSVHMETCGVQRQNPYFNARSCPKQSRKAERRENRLTYRVIYRLDKWLSKTEFGLWYSNR